MENDTPQKAVNWPDVFSGLYEMPDYPAYKYVKDRCACSFPHPAHDWCKGVPFVDNEPQSILGMRVKVNFFLPPNTAAIIQKGQPPQIIRITQNEKEKA